MQDGGQLQQIVRMALERVLAREQRCTPAGATGPAPAPPPAAAQSSSLSPKPIPNTTGYVKSPGEVVIAADHGGFELKQDLAGFLKEAGWRVRDLGTTSAEAVDYPDFALKVAAAIAKGDAWRGIMIDGMGIGSSMAANKVPGIRAAVCFDAASTKNAREHNDANVMCLGGRVVDPAKAREMARIFLETDFGGDRHARRVDKIVAIERLFLGAGRAER